LHDKDWGVVVLRYLPGTNLLIRTGVLEGRKAILARSGLLEAFAEQVGQPGAMHWLGYFLAGPAAAYKKPYLVVLMRSGADIGSLHLRDIIALAMFVEFRPLGIRTGAFSTDDSTCLRSVVAAPGQHRHVAAIASEVLIERGAHVVLTSHSRCAWDDAAGRPRLERAGLLWAEQQRTMRRQMFLAETYEGTLARLGKSTRRTMRYVRRRLESKTGCCFVPNAAGLLNRAEIEKMNLGSLNPIEVDELRMRLKASSLLPGGFLAGLRSRDGQWLSLVGGWRQGTFTCMHWQMNARGFEKYSIGSAMRAYFLEHEVERGTRTLYFYGGTVHSMQNSFQEECAWDLIVRRKSLHSRLLMAAAKLVNSPRGLTGRKNFLASTLLNKDLIWNESAAVRDDSAGAIKLGASGAGLLPLRFPEQRKGPLSQAGDHSDHRRRA
jgi:hypothetical protein